MNRIFNILGIASAIIVSILLVQRLAGGGVAPIPEVFQGRTSLEAAIAEASRHAGAWIGSNFVAVAVERVDNIISAEDRLLDKKHATVYTCGDLSALWAWGHVGPHVQVPAAV